MSTFEMVILIGAVCGLIMVAGGILLLYKGAISLTEASKEEALSVEFQKRLKITTHYPALGLFVIGLGFVATAIWASLPETIRPVQVLGHVTLADLEPSSATVTISVGQWIARPSSDGRIAQTITMYPNIDLLVVESIAPGHPPVRSFKRLASQELRSGTIDLADIVFAAPVVPKPQPDPSSDRPLDVKLPPLEAAGTFR